MGLKNKIANKISKMIGATETIAQLEKIIDDLRAETKDLSFSFEQQTVDKLHALRRGTKLTEDLEAANRELHGLRTTVSILQRENRQLVDALAMEEQEIAKLQEKMKKKVKRGKNGSGRKT